MQMLNLPKQNSCGFMQITKYKYVFGEGEGRVYSHKFPQEIIQIKIQESHECNYSASLIFI